MRRMLVLMGALLLGGSVAQAHDVKDPVCRMTVDSDTAKWKHRLGNKSFYFCSRQCEARFVTSPEKYEKLAAQLERQDLHDYTVEFKTDAPAVAGQPVTMEFAIRYAGTGKLVQEFEVVHERLLHLLMTTADLAWFEHQHPVRGADGRFRLTWRFPRPGSYRLYADFTPADGDNQVKPLTLVVGGGAQRTVALRPDRARVKQIGDLRFELKVQGEPLRMEKPMLLTYTVRDRHGRPVRDLQPFIGAPGHLIAISQDGKEVVHTHSLQTAAQHSMAGERELFQVTPAMVTEKGPNFSFKLTTPTGGLYRTWAQFMRGNRVYTVPFTFQVEDLWSRSAADVSAKTAPPAALGKVALLRPPAGGIQPQAVVDRQGVVHLLYLRGAPDAGDLYYVKQKPGQSDFSSPLRVNSQPGSAVAVGTIRGGQLALGKGGRVHVVWFGSSKARPRGPGDSTPMLYTRLNDSGAAFEPERNLMQSTRLLDGGGSVAADPAGNVYVTWHASDGQSEKESDRRLWVVRSRDEGKSFTREAPTSPPGTGACACCLTRAFVDRRGTFFQLYRAARENVDRDMMLLTSRDRGDRFQSQPLQPWKIDACPMSSMSFAEGKSAVVAAWETEGQVYYARIDPGTFQVSPPIAAPGSGPNRKHPAVAVNARGETLLVWTEGTGWQKGGDLAWQLFDTSGGATEVRGQIKGGVPVWGLATAVTRPDGGFTVLY